MSAIILYIWFDGFDNVLNTSLNTCSFNIPIIKYQYIKANQLYSTTILNKVVGLSDWFLNPKDTASESSAKQIDSGQPAVTLCRDAMRKQLGSMSYCYISGPQDQIQCIAFIVLEMYEHLHEMLLCDIKQKTKENILMLFFFFFLNGGLYRFVRIVLVLCAQTFLDIHL